MAKGGHQTTNPPAAAFHNSLDDGNASITPGVPTKSGLPPISSRCQRAYQTRVTFGPVLLCRKKHLATYCKLGNALSLRVDDIGRRRLLTQPRPGRQLPVVSAFRVSEGQLHHCPVLTLSLSQNHQHQP
jgi:hypothetical protein